jgi:hypothetical protein
MADFYKVQPLKLQILCIFCTQQKADNCSPLLPCFLAISRLKLGDASKVAIPPWVKLSQDGKGNFVSLLVIACLL